jgi:hypothetical protein
MVRGRQLSDNSVGRLFQGESTGGWRGHHTTRQGRSQLVPCEREKVALPRCSAVASLAGVMAAGYACFEFQAELTQTGSSPRSPSAAAAFPAFIRGTPLTPRPPRERPLHRLQARPTTALRGPGGVGRVQQRVQEACNQRQGADDGEDDDSPVQAPRSGHVPPSPCASRRPPDKQTARAPTGRAPLRPLCDPQAKCLFPRSSCSGLRTSRCR